MLVPLDVLTSFVVMADGIAKMSWWYILFILHSYTPLSMFIGALLICGKWPNMGLLNSMAAGLGSHAPTGVDHICNKARLISWLVFF